MLQVTQSTAKSYITSGCVNSSKEALAHSLVNEHSTKKKNLQPSTTEELYLKTDNIMGPDLHAQHQNSNILPEA